MDDDGLDDGGPESGVRNRFAPEAAEALTPALRDRVSPHLMSVGRCMLMGSGDKRPPVLRPGSQTCAALLSRVGRTLRWPDGRVTPADEPRHSPQDLADALDHIGDLMQVYSISPSEVAA